MRLKSVKNKLFYFISLIRDFVEPSSGIYDTSGNGKFFIKWSPDCHERVKADKPLSALWACFDTRKMECCQTRESCTRKPM